MNRRMWIQLEQWYHSLHLVQQWVFKVMLALVAVVFIAMITHEPRERTRQARIILDCNPGCGVDPERAISYNEYIERKEREQKAWFREDKKRIQQEIWDEKGRARWCQTHPQDRNCK